MTSSRSNPQRIRDLEREVGRLKAAIVDMEGSLKEAKLSYVQGEADRADAERLQFIFRADSMCATLDEFRSAIDADMAKDPHL